MLPGKVLEEVLFNAYIVMRIVNDRGRAGAEIDRFDAQSQHVERDVVCSRSAIDSEITRCLNAFGVKNKDKVLMLAFAIQHRKTIYATSGTKDFYRSMNSHNLTCLGA